MSWYPKTLKCQFYENGVLLDLAKVGNAELESLADEVFKFWKMSSGSAVWFDVEIYEKRYWFKPTKVSMEVVCFKINPTMISGKEQVSISKMYVEEKVGKKFKIQPKNTPLCTWIGPEVAFVV